MHRVFLTYLDHILPIELVTDDNEVSLAIFRYGNQNWINYQVIHASEIGQDIDKSVFSYLMRV